MPMNITYVKRAYGWDNFAMPLHYQYPLEQQKKLMFFGQQNSEMCFMHDLKTNRISGFTENVKLEEKNVLCTSRFATHAN